MALLNGKVRKYDSHCVSAMGLEEKTIFKFRDCGVHCGVIEQDKGNKLSC